MDTQAINGFAYGWSSISIQFDGNFYYGIKSISFADKIETSKSYGLGRHFAPVGSTQGKYSADDGKLVMRLDSYQGLSVDIAQKGLGTSVSAARFAVSVQWIEPAGSPIVRVLEGCRIIGVSDSAGQDSADESTVELTLEILRIRRDGLSLFQEISAL